VKFIWIQQHREEFELAVMCDTLDVSRSGYYAWLKRPVSPRQKRRQELTEQIRRVHDESRCTYGSPRVHAELVDRRVSVCLNTVARLMQRAGLQSKIRRRFVVHTTDSRHDHPVAVNALDRQFGAEAPNRKWCCDITYVPTDEGFLYLAAVIDLCSRKIVGWSMADHLRSELCLDALSMALMQRRPEQGLLHHSDRGVQYACESYRQMLAENGIEASMSRTGNCYDNAVMESFFSTLKTELIYHQHYATRAHARSSIFEYIEAFYNRQRRHSAIGYKSPEAFEAGLN
jgi:transposase InsO family protein